MPLKNDRYDPKFNRLADILLQRKIDLDKALNSRELELSKENLLKLLFSNRVNRDRVVVTEIAQVMKKEGFSLTAEEFHDVLLSVGPRDDFSFLKFLMKLQPIFGVESTGLTHEILMQKMLFFKEYDELDYLFSELDRSGLVISHNMYYVMFASYKSRRMEDVIKDFYAKYIEDHRIPLYGVLKEISETFKTKKYLSEHVWLVGEFEKYEYELSIPLLQNSILQSARVRDFTLLYKYYDILKNTDQIKPQVMFITSMMSAAVWTGNYDFYMDIFHLLDQYKLEIDFTLVVKLIETIEKFKNTSYLDEIMRTVNKFTSKQDTEFILLNQEVYSILIKQFLISESLNFKDSMDILFKKLSSLPKKFLLSHILLEFTNGRQLEYEDFIKQFSSIQEKYKIETDSNIFSSLLAFTSVQYPENLDLLLQSFSNWGLNMKKQDFMNMILSTKGNAEAGMLFVKAYEKIFGTLPLVMIETLLESYENSLSVENAEKYFYKITATVEDFDHKGRAILQFVPIYSSMLMVCLNNHNIEKALFYFDLYFETFGEILQSRCTQPFFKQLAKTHPQLLLDYVEVLYTDNPSYPKYLTMTLILPYLGKKKMSDIEKVKLFFDRFNIDYTSEIYAVLLDYNPDPEVFMTLLDEIHQEFSVKPTNVHFSQAIRKVLASSKYEYLIDVFKWAENFNLKISLVDDTKTANRLNHYLTDEAKQHFKIFE